MIVSEDDDDLIKIIRSLHMYQLGDLVKSKSVGYRFEANDKTIISFKEDGIEIKIDDIVKKIPYETTSLRD